MACLLHRAAIISIDVASSSVNITTEKVDMLNRDRQANTCNRAIGQSHRFAIHRRLKELKTVLTEDDYRCCRLTVPENTTTTTTIGTQDAGDKRRRLCL